MIMLGDVAAMLKTEIGCWISSLVCRSMGYSQRYSVFWGDIFFCVLPKQKYLMKFVCLFVSQGDSVVASGGKKNKLKGAQRRYLGIPDITSECSGHCGLFSLKRKLKLMGQGLVTTCT